MRILILLKKWDGGVGAVIKSIRTKLTQGGHKVICISREDDLKYFSSTRNLFLLRRKYREIIEREKPDIIYSQDWSVALPLVLPYRIFKERHFCCFHGNQRGVARPIQWIVGRGFKRRLFVVGDSLKKRFPNAHLVYNGVNLRHFRPLNKKRDCVGWIKKDTEILTMEELLSLAKKLNLDPLVAEKFEIPFERMNRDFYNKCKVFISMPQTAGFNLCWVEAMAAGVPIIIGNDEGIGWRLNIDKIGTKKELFMKAKKLKEKDYRKEIKKSGLTWESHIEKLLEVWKNEKL